MNPNESRLSPYLESTDETSSGTQNRTIKPSTDREVLMVSIVPMVKSDATKIMPIEETSFENPYSPYKICELLQYEDHFGLLALNDDEEVVGYAIVEIRSKCLGIVSIAVAKEHREKLVGSQLVNMIVNLAHGNCRDIVVTVVRKSNTRAQTFFEKQKFIQVDESSNAYNECPNEPACTYLRYIPRIRSQRQFLSNDQSLN